MQYTVNDFDQYYRTAGGLIIKDPNRMGRINPNEFFIPYWSKPKINDQFVWTKASLLTMVKKRSCFLTPEDQVLIELLDNVDAELLLENKEIMERFETIYRFFRSLYP